MTEEQAIERIAQAIADLHFRTVEDHGHNPASYDIAVVAWNEMKAIAREDKALAGSVCIPADTGIQP